MLAIFLILSLCLWLFAIPWFIFCELFELSDKGNSNFVQIHRRKRQLLLSKELPLFLLCRLPKTIWQRLKTRFSSGLACCYRVPHYAEILGGTLPRYVYCGDTVQLSLSFPWKNPLQGAEDPCGNVSNFIYCNTTFCPSLEIEVEAEGIEIKAPYKKSHKLSTLPVKYTWELIPRKTGHFFIKLVARLDNGPQSLPSVAVAAYKIRVRKLPLLTAQQARWAGSLCTGLTVFLFLIR